MHVHPHSVLPGVRDLQFRNVSLFRVQTCAPFCVLLVNTTAIATYSDFNKRIIERFCHLRSNRASAVEVAQKVLEIRDLPCLPAALSKGLRLHL